MTIENLTAETRAAFYAGRFGIAEARVALRIIDALTAEAERLRAALQESANITDSDLQAVQLARNYISAHNALVSRLTAATALVNRMQHKCAPGTDGVYERAEAFFTNQPAEPARTEET